jgi:TolA-binding protein
MLEIILTSNELMKKATGLEMKQFQELSSQIRQVEKRNKSEENRMRSAGGGRKPKLSFDEQVLLVLFWYKLYLPLWLLGLIASLDSSNVSRLIDKYKRLIEEAADPELEERMANLKEGSEISIDATEQRIRRPSRKQKCYYSGAAHNENPDSSCLRERDSAGSVKITSRLCA